WNSFQREVREPNDVVSTRPPSWQRSILYRTRGWNGNFRASSGVRFYGRCCAENLARDENMLQKVETPHADRFVECDVAWDGAEDLDEAEHAATFFFHTLIGAAFGLAGFAV